METRDGGTAEGDALLSVSTRERRDRGAGQHQPELTALSQGGRATARAGGPRLPHLSLENREDPEAGSRDGMGEVAAS